MRGVFSLSPMKKVLLTPNRLLGDPSNTVGELDPSVQFILRPLFYKERGAKTAIQRQSAPNRKGRT